jgi:hypothetical protein
MARCVQVGTLHCAELSCAELTGITQRTETPQIAM